MKQVIVVNGSLMLPMGKLAAQVAHAAVCGALAAKREVREAWDAEGMTKIVLLGRDEHHLTLIHASALGFGVKPAGIIKDAGRTVIPEGTMTCMFIGPALDADIDKITGTLPLL